MIVLDTHALLWWALDPAALSKRATSICEDMERKGGFASSISIWELGIKVARRHLDIGIDIAELARRVVASGVVELLPVDTEVWLASLGLKWRHRDPADRVIVATALMKGLPILSKDRTIRRFKGAQCLW